MIHHSSLRIAFARRHLLQPLRTDCVSQACAPVPVRIAVRFQHCCSARRRRDNMASKDHDLVDTGITFASGAVVAARMRETVRAAALPALAQPVTALPAQESGDGHG